MSIIYETSNISVISHQCFLTKSYGKVTKDKQENPLKCNPNFFSIYYPYKPLSKVKRKRRKANDSENSLFVSNTFMAAQSVIKGVLKCICCRAGKEGVAKEAADQFYQQSALRRLGDVKGGNDSIDNIVAKINGDDYVIPNSCKFFNYDISEMKKHLNDAYDFILLDPPWWNKFIRRKKAKDLDCYGMMWNSDLSKLHINAILKEDGLVAVWCTNAESHFESLIKEIFPAWGLDHVATWFWIKVTVEGEPVTPFSPANGKQPFERIIFAARKSSRHFPLPENKRLLVSVPSSIHSHKPPLCDVIKPYIPSSPKCLEIFARYLLPGWTSYGNEVLKMQHASFFIEA